MVLFDFLYEAPRIGEFSFGAESFFGYAFGDLLLKTLLCQ